MTAASLQSIANENAKLYSDSGAMLTPEEIAERPASSPTQSAQTTDAVRPTTPGEARQAIANELAKLPAVDHNGRPITTEVAPDDTDVDTTGPTADDHRAIHDRALELMADDGLDADDALAKATRDLGFGPPSVDLMQGNRGDNVDFSPQPEPPSTVAGINADFAIRSRLIAQQANDIAEWANTERPPHR